MQEAASSGVRKLDWAGGAAAREVVMRCWAAGAKASVPERRARNARVDAFMVLVLTVRSE